MPSFHERIKELRDASEKTQVQIAEALNITPQALSYYINGREPSYDILMRMADFFNVSIDYLMGRSEFKNFEQELEYKNRIGNEQLYKAFPDGEKMLISINEHFSTILHDLMGNEGDKFSDNALVTLDQLLGMILYIKKTLSESFSDMEEYIDLLKVLKYTNVSYNITLESVEISQTQVDACKKRLNEFIHLYIYTIFDFEKMRLKEGK